MAAKTENSSSNIVALQTIMALSPKIEKTNQVKNQHEFMPKRAAIHQTAIPEKSAFKNLKFSLLLLTFLIVVCALSLSVL